MLSKKETIFIKTDYITLGQFLKYTNIISSGSYAKNFLLSNTVYVDGAIENRRGRKLYNNSIVKIATKEYLILGEK